ncbi:MAG TPA: hypothetical protein VNS50_11385, partial [Ginsengibacter sp.]|nr:hypothetical protein [Ginsengibacter sp.]
MKKQNKFLRRTSIAFILLGTLSWTGCNQGNAQGNAHQSVGKIAAPAIGIHTAIVTGNIAVVKQY